MKADKDPKYIKISLFKEMLVGLGWGVCVCVCMHFHISFQ